MAGIIGIAQAPAAALTATVARTVVQVVSAANTQCEIKEISIGFDGVSSTEKHITVEVCRQSTAGTSSALTMVYPETLPTGVTPTTTARHSATVEPTTGDVLVREYVHPQGKFIWRPSDTDRIWMFNGGRIGVVCTAPSGVSPNALGRIVTEE